MSWKKIVKNEFGDERFSIAANGNSFFDGVFDNADLRFGISESTFGKIIDLIKQNKDAYDSYEFSRNKDAMDGIYINFKFTEEPDSFDSLAGKILEILKNQSMLKEFIDRRDYNELGRHSKKG